MSTADPTRGQVRHDGYLFLGYYKDSYGIREKWVSPERWEKIREYNREYHKTYRPKTKCEPS